MTMVRIVFLCIISVTVNSCGIHEAVKTEDAQNCKAVIEGFLNSKVTFIRKGPALIFNQSRDESIIYGQIVSKNDSGIFFLQDPFYTPDPTFFSYKNIQCAIDSNRTIIYGKLPKRFQFYWGMEWSIVSIDDSSQEPIKMVLNANKPFSYCLKPGTYCVSDIEFEGNYSEFVDKADSLPRIIFNVETNKVNNLGTINLDFTNIFDSSVCVIPSIIDVRPMQERAFMRKPEGLLGKILKSYGVKILSENHMFTVSQDSIYESTIPLLVVKSQISFDNVQVPIRKQ
jgi:hypothetical protein